MSAKLNVDIVAQLKEFNKSMTELKSEVNDVNKSISQSNEETTKSTKKMGSAFADVGKTMAAVFTVDLLVNLGKKNPRYYRRIPKDGGGFNDRSR